jgi:hypothetical protein
MRLGDGQGNDEAGPQHCVRVATALNPAAAPIGTPFRLPCVQVRGAERGFDVEWHLASAAFNNRHACVAVTHSRLNPSGYIALRGHGIQVREPGMVNSAGWLDQLFGPAIGS